MVHPTSPVINKCSENVATLKEVIVDSTNKKGHSITLHIQLLAYRLSGGIYVEKGKLVSYHYKGFF